MAVKLAVGSNILGNQGIVATTTNEWGEYIRPTDWIDIPNPTQDSYLYGLFGVTEYGPNYVTVWATVNTGTWSVDWGDGNVVAGSGVTKHEYNFNDIDPSTEIVRGGVKMRQVIIKLISTHNFTNFRLFYKHTSDIASIGEHMWLDIEMGSPELVQPRLSYPFAASARCQWLEKVKFTNIPNTINLHQAFRGCTALKQILGLDGKTTADLTYTFSGCYSLLRLPVLDTSAGAIHSGCFNATNFRKYPYSMNNGAALSYQFFNAYGLTEFPKDLVPVANMTSFAIRCYAVQEIPIWNWINTTNAYQAFYTCISIKKAILPNFHNVTDARAIFFGDVSLEEVEMDTSGVSLANEMFRGCASLIGVELNCANMTVTTDMFLGCVMLQKCVLNGLTRGVNLNATSMTRLAAIELFNSLGTASGSQTITLTNTPAALTLTADDIAIATGKGFTVTV